MTTCSACNFAACAALVQVSPAGEVLQTLMDPTGSHISHVSAVTEHQGQLFLGNLAKDYVSVLRLE